MSTPDFEVTIAGQSDRAEVLALLTDGYGRPFLADWFEWKHVQGPWGPSVCFVARDRDGLLGVAFRMPWPLLAGDTPVKASRLVDGTTSPRALRRGVFREVVRNMLTRWDEEEPSEVVLATATPPALAAHVKNGATALEPIEFSYRPVRHARAEVQ